MSKKCVVYTALFGDYDDLIEPIKEFEDCDFICFTNNKNLKSKLWKIIYVENSFLSNSLMNRYYKMFPHLFFKEYEYSIYIDSNIKILSNPYELIEKYLKNDKEFLAIPKHPYRSCFYDEIPLLIRAGRVSFFKLYNQVFYYLKKGYFGQINLTENNIILRKHNNDVCKKIMKIWWKHVNLLTPRDQLSLGYILYKYNINFTYMKENARDNKNFCIYPHKIKQTLIIKKILFNSVPYFLSIIINKFLKRKCK